MPVLHVSQVLDAEFVEASRACPWCGVSVPESEDCPRPSDYCDHPVLSPPRSTSPARGETLAAPLQAANVGGTLSSLFPAKGLSPRRPPIQNRIAWLDVALFFQTGVKFP